MRNVVIRGSSLERTVSKSCWATSSVGFPSDPRSAFSLRRRADHERPAQRGLRPLLILGVLRPACES